MLREDVFKAKPGWRTQCSEKFKKQMQVSSRFHYQRRRDEEGRAIKKVKFEEVLVSLPPVGRLKHLEQYAYEGKDFGAFDDTDKAVGRKAISILFSGRDGFIDEQLARFPVLPDCGRDCVVWRAGYVAQTDWCGSDSV